MAKAHPAFAAYKDVAEKDADQRSQRGSSGIDKVVRAAGERLSGTIYDTDARVSRLLYELLRVLHDQEQVIGVRWAGVEVEMFIECPGIIVLG